MIWLTNQQACEPVIQITVCKGYLLLFVPQICGTNREPAGCSACSLAEFSVSCVQVIRELQQQERYDVSGRRCDPATTLKQSRTVEVQQIMETEQDRKEES